MNRGGVALAVVFGLLAQPIATYPWLPSIPSVASASDETLIAAIAIDELEYRVGKQDDASWDATLWWGSDRNRLYVSTEGEQRVEGRRAGDAELRVRYSRMLSAFWDARAGVRHDWFSGRASGPGRTFAVLGVAGLAPGWIELEPELAIDQDGDFFLRLCADYDLQISQSIVAATSIELDAAFQDSAALRVERGLTQLSLESRIRYEILAPPLRTVAPYVGVVYVRQLGETGDAVARLGGDRAAVSFVAGVALHF